MGVLLWLAAAGPALAVSATSESESFDSTVDQNAMDQDAVAQLLATFELRNVGPFRQGSWITAIAAPEVDPLGPQRAFRHTFYVGARNGGVWKTTNNGVTFSNVTDSNGRNGISAVGSLAVAKSDPQVVWVGTGDSEVARSSYSGTGVWRSEDGGASWQHRGLERAHHIARVRIHPSDAETVWVASMGQLFSPNPERGVFKTRDGGATWQHVLDLGPEVGVIDLVVDQERPDRLWATAYDKVRLPWHFEAGGERSGVYRSEDGGDSWQRLIGGFPQAKLGRIGIDHFRNRSPDRANGGAQKDILYTIVENLTPRQPTAEERKSDAEFTKRTGKEAEPRVVGNEVYRTDDGGDTWMKVSPEGLSVGSKSAYAFNEIRVDPWHENKIYVLSETLISSVDGGRSYRDASWPMKELYATIFGDVRSMWINPRDPEHILLGSDGGVFPSYDGGKTADHLLNLPLAEIYDVAVDNRNPYNIYAGLQDHEAWRAPVNSWSGSVGIEDWVMVGRWDGMVNQISPDNRWYYATTQFGNHLRVDLERGERTDIVPVAPDGEPRYRYTWTTPLEISPHDSAVLWTGAQRLLRSPDRGDTWRAVSPDLTDDDAKKIQGKGHIRYNTITTHAESHLEAGLVWVGTDDGRVWLTRDAGRSWQESTAELSAAGMPRDRWVSRVVPSRHALGRAYVAKSGYRRDDFAPYLFSTDDFGRTWVDRSGRDGDAPLPDAPISVVLEDPVNPDLLFVGNDVGVYATLDGGGHWFSFGKPASDADRGRMPRVPVRDLALQEREADLVVGTYGRGAWVGNVRPLREATAENLQRSAWLFEVEPKPLNLTQRDEWGAHELYGDAVVKTANESDGLSIYLWLGEGAGSASLSVVRTSDGAELGRHELPVGAGMQVVRFPFAKAEAQAEDPQQAAAGKDLSDQNDSPDQASEAADSGTGSGQVEIGPGEVEIVLTVDGEEQRRRSRILPAPAQPVG